MLPMEQEIGPVCEIEILDKVAVPRRDREQEDRLGALVCRHFLCVPSKVVSAKESASRPNSFENE